MASINSWHVIGWPDSCRTLAAASRALSLPLLVLSWTAGAGGASVAAAGAASATAVAAALFARAGLERWTADSPWAAWPWRVGADAAVVEVLLLRFIIVCLRN